MRYRPLSFALLALALAACSEPESAETPAKAAHGDLFACDMAFACDELNDYLDPGPVSARTCAAQFLANGQIGLIRAVGKPDPDIDETEQWILHLGSREVLVQSRHRACNGDCSENVPWGPVSAHRICDAYFEEGVEKACLEGDTFVCSWSPWGPGGLTNCEEVDDFSCDDVAAVLQP